MALELVQDNPAGQNNCQLECVQRGETQGWILHIHPSFSLNPCLAAEARGPTRSSPSQQRCKNWWRKRQEIWLVLAVGPISLDGAVWSMPRALLSPHIQMYMCDEHCWSTILLIPCGDDGRIMTVPSQQKMQKPIAKEPPKKYELKKMNEHIESLCSSEMLGGQAADFLRGVAFWSIRSPGLLRWFCATGAALRMTWHHFFVAGAVL